MRMQVRSPGLAWWIKDQALPRVVVYVADTLRPSVDVGVVYAGTCSSNLTPSLGTFICFRYSPKKQKNKKQKCNYFFFLRPHLWHMEAPMLGVESDHCVTSCRTVTYAAAGDRSFTHWARPGIKPASSQMLSQVLNLLSHDRNSKIFFIFNHASTWYFK